MEQTYFAGSPRADLIKPDFDTLIYQKGRDVIHETAIQCPCKSKATNQSSGCRNCGGTGWLFINPKPTRMVLQGIDVVNEFRPWSEELRGVVNITAHSEVSLSLMDRITALDGEAIHSEVLYLKQKGDDVFTYTTYDIKEVLYIALFVNDNTPLRKLEPNIDYVIERNIVQILVDDLPFVEINQNNITIRYKHAPQFHVIEMKRDTIQSFIWQGFEKLQHLPVSAIGKRSHYQLSAENLSNDRLIDNSYTTDSC